MAVDLDILRLDLPHEDFSKPDGVSRFWRFSTLAMLLALGGMAWLHWYYDPPGADADRIAVRPYTVEHATAARQSMFTAGGWVEPSWPYPVKVTARVDGYISMLFAVEGMDVESGDVIAMIEDAPFRAELEVANARYEAALAKLQESRSVVNKLRAGPRDEELEVASAEVATARATLERMKAGYRDEEVAAAEARVAEARAVGDYRRKRADRYRGLSADNVVPSSVADEYESEARAAEEALKVVGQELLKLRAGFREVEIAEARAALAEAERRYELIAAGVREEEIAQARAAVASAQALTEVYRAEVDYAEQRIEWCQVRAPESGRVLELLLRQGSRVNDDNPVILTLYDPTQMQARVDVRQEQAAALHLGQIVSIRLESRAGLPYRGEVIRIDPLANLARDTVRARVQILDPDHFLRQDLTVTTDFMPRAISHDTGQMPLVLPRSAVLTEGEGSFVFVIRGGVAHRTSVELGEDTGGGVVAVSGVVAGDLIANSNVALLSDGAAVRFEEGAEQDG